MDWIKGVFIPTKEQSDANKQKMSDLFYQTTKIDKKEALNFVYANYNDQETGLTTRTYIYYNYVIWFNNSGKFIILPIDSDIKIAWEVTYVNLETTKKVSKTMFGKLYEVELNNGKDIKFMIPTSNGNLLVLLNQYQIAIEQKEEAKLFKEFFDAHYGK